MNNPLEIHYRINIFHLHMLNQRIRNYLYNCSLFQSSKYHSQLKEHHFYHSSRNYNTYCYCKKPRFNRVYQFSLVKSKRYNLVRKWWWCLTNNRHPLLHLSIECYQCMASMYRNQLNLLLGKAKYNHNSLFRISSNLISYLMSSKNRLVKNVKRDQIS